MPAAGYTTGGAIHVVVNNQVGFTTLPREARSSWHASDLAKAVRAPIWHANAGPACLWLCAHASDPCTPDRSSSSALHDATVVPCAQTSARIQCLLCWMSICPVH